jgi:two-component system cell cycle sensor histidine kinase/response regulator CckA
MKQQASREVIMGSIGSNERNLVRLPRGSASIENANPGESGTRRAAGQPRRVLLVEDEEMVRKVLARMLGARGFEVYAAGGCAEAMSVFTAQRDDGFDLLVTDLMMPDGAGLVIARHLSEKLPALRVLFVSGYSSAEMEGLDPERYRFLTKPFGSAELVRMIDDLFEMVPASVRPG